MDDPTDDFNRVTTSIKEDISGLNSKLNEIEVRSGAGARDGVSVGSCGWGQPGLGRYSSP